MSQLINAEFLICENKTKLEGIILILQTSSPFYVAKVLKYKDTHQFLTVTHNNPWLSFVVVPGYRVIIQFYGSLLNGRILKKVNSETQVQIDNLMENMGNFYYQERILAHKGYYNKFKI